MLQLYDLNHSKLHGLTNYKDLKRERTLDGEEILSFLYPQSDSKYSFVKEETYIRTKDNEYVVKEVNIDDDWTEFVAKINVEDLKGHPFSHFESIEQSCMNTVNLAIAGTGWTIGSCDVTKLRTVRKSNCNSYDILQEIKSVYSCDFKFDAINKKIYIYQTMGSDKGSYFSEELNLKKLNVQSNSYDYCT
jgi:phage minor structural protein